MIAQFDWWLLVVGIVGGAGLVWLVVAEFRRREEDVAVDELALEASWIAEAITDVGRPIDDETVGEVLRLHRAYLAGPIPDLDPVGQEPETYDREAATSAGAPGAALPDGDVAGRGASAGYGSGAPASSDDGAADVP
jgi:hypothetical protein